MESTAPKHRSAIVTLAMGLLGVGFILAGAACPLFGPTDKCKDVVCPDGEVCNPDTGECEPEAIECDPPCGEGEVCNPDTGECEPEAIECDPPCGEGEVCNPDTGECEPEAIECDPPCGEGEVCNPDTGECEPEAIECDPPCGEGEVCNPDTGECEPEAIECDPPCGEGEFCDTQTGECVPSENLYETVEFDHDFHSGAYSCGDCHHDGAGFDTCDTCHDRDEVVGGIAVLKDVMHDPDGGCRQCHTDETAEGLWDCTKCHTALSD